MKIETRTRGVYAPELDRHVEARLRRVLGRFAHRVRHVGVVLRDLNGPRGGEDTHCRVQLHLRPAGLIVAEDVRETALEAVASAADRARRRLNKTLERRHQRRQAAARG
jgi:ribosomal subunit interface protein